MSAVSEVSAARITQREFARREGCDEKVVRRAVTDGRLPRDDDKLLSAALLGSGWRRQSKTRMRLTADTPDAADTSADTQAAPPTLTDVRSDASAPASPTEESRPGDPVYEARRTASAKREFYAGEEAELTYRKRRGELIELATAKQVLFDEFRAARDAWLAWPGNNAALIAATLGVEPGPVLEVLTLYVRKQIDALAEPTGREFKG